MKFTCTKNNIAQALSLVGSIASKNINLPILNNVLIKAVEQKVEIVATNLELAVVVNVRTKVEEPGDFTVPAKTLAEFVNLLPEETISFVVVENEMVITCAKSATKIKGMSAEDYPVIPEVGEGNGYLLKAEDFKKSLSQVASSAARNDIRPELSGILFNFNNKNKEVTMAATDSYRLAEKKVKIEQGDQEFRVIVPLRAALEITHILSSSGEEQREKTTRIMLSDSQIVVNYENVQVISRLVDGQYPDYEQIIPTQFKTTAIFSVDQLIKEIKAASLFSSQNINGVNLEFEATNGIIKINSASSQTGDYNSEITAKITGENNNIFLNYRYFLEGLNHIGEAEAKLEIINADSPCLITGATTENFKYVVMPIRQ